MKTVIPVIFVHNRRDSRYEVHSSSGSIAFGIHQDTPYALAMLIGYARDREEVEVVPINGPLGKAILWVVTSRNPHLAPSSTPPNLNESLGGNWDEGLYQ